MLWSLFNFFGTAASIGTAASEIHRHGRQSEMEKTTIYIGLGVLTIVGLAFVEHRKKKAAVVATSAAVVASATQPTVVTTTPALAASAATGAPPASLAPVSSVAPVAAM